MPSRESVPEWEDDARRNQKKRDKRGANEKKVLFKHSPETFSPFSLARSGQTAKYARKNEGTNVSTGTRIFLLKSIYAEEEARQVSSVMMLKHSLELSDTLGMAAALFRTLKCQIEMLSLLSLVPHFGMEAKCRAIVSSPSRDPHPTSSPPFPCMVMKYVISARRPNYFTADLTDSCCPPSGPGPSSSFVRSARTNGALKSREKKDL